MLPGGTQVLLPKGTYVIEVLRRPHDVRRLLIFVVLHPALSEEFPVRETDQKEKGNCWALFDQQLLKMMILTHME